MMMDEGAEPRQEDQSELAKLTTDIVTAFVSHNLISPSDLTGLIDVVGHALREIGRTPEEPQPTKPEPAVPVRRSVTADQITCLICGRSQKTLRRHLAATHDLTPDVYRELYGLKPDYPMVAPNYAQQRSEMAKRIGLGQKQPPPPRRRPRKRRTAAPDRTGSAEGESQG
jgi:predicted transcriptional regulator